MTAINLGNVRGAKGDTGATGAKGDKGDKGDTGSQGLPGNYSGEWATAFPVFGQPSIKLNELNDALYRADKRFPVTSNVPNFTALFDGSFDTPSNSDVGVSTGNYVDIDFYNGDGLSGANGLYFAGGEILVSFYHTSAAFSNIQLELTTNYPTYAVTTLNSYTNVSTSGIYRVLKFTLPVGTYALTRLKLLFDSTGATSLAALNYFLTRYSGTPPPYVSSSTNYNWAYGSLNINNKLRLGNDGKIAINSATTQPENLYVNGTSRFTGAMKDSTGSYGSPGQVWKNVAGLPVWSNP